MPCSLQGIIFLWGTLVISLALAKKHLRILNNQEDDLISLLINAALPAIAGYLDRELTDPKCLINGSLAAPLVAAGLLIIGDLYANREAQQNQALVINPTCQNLMNPYRKMGV